VKRPIHESAVSWQTWYTGTDREIRGKALCDVGGTARVGVGLLELPPGSHTRPGHHHSHEEEHLYALAGEANLHLGAQTFVLVAGSYVCFPAGQAVAHHLHNTGTQPFRYLMIGERIAEDEVTYPDGDATADT
jgi:uncharacterized cupin superfamily protein